MSDKDAVMESNVHSTRYTCGTVIRIPSLTAPALRVSRLIDVPLE